MQSIISASLRTNTLVQMSDELHPLPIDLERATRAIVPMLRTPLHLCPHFLKRAFQPAGVLCQMTEKLLYAHLIA